ncbi:MAG TPA: SRPBCC family protein [Candidatus Dormibacteraeota bacterium]|jgi:uncharacterized protein YndB with AHSA1/START domain|nr:SRPBCC family protein [Candidatus Dormibacteraeota bacterium]
MSQVEVTGACTEVEIEVEVPAERMWGLITDVGRIGEWSPEVRGGGWLEGEGPRPGARFLGRNGWRDGEVTCVVTEAERPGVFAWVVLDAARDPERPGSIWRYELSPGSRPGTTRVRNRFTHGSGHTGLARIIEQDPERGQDHLRSRLEQLRSNMVRTIEAMARSQSAGSTTAPGAARMETIR